ncbi:MAG: UDP-N-acetylmuramate--L-alanine ligase [Candidatus Desulfofervidaceae bacterium]|nr:UDP-N-acetylmuramate--L-alanine ligase [Candidatus Desulfofervidaceae bacterium]
MSGLASILLELGYHVSGSDIQPNRILARLEEKGAQIYIGHQNHQIDGAQVVVFSSAIKPNNPELIAAKEKKLPLISRGQLLALLMEEKKGIAVAGTHGKTTTSSMLATILETAGTNPTVVIGGCINGSGVNAWWGNGPYLVAEADESDGSFLLLHPYITVITNIEADHLDYYQDLGNIKKAFAQFLKQLKPGGKAIVWGDDSEIKDIIKQTGIPYLTYGLTPGQDFEAREVCLNTLSQFNLYIQGRNIGQVTLSLPGKHNVLNALAALAAAWVLNIDMEMAIYALKNFKGVGRRLEVKGEKNGIMVIDDYAHHPTEIKMTLNAIKQKWPGRRLITIFQPHRYSRTKSLYQEFLTVFSETDELILTEIYAASEQPIPGVTGRWLADGIERYRSIYYCPDFEAIMNKLNKLLQPGDIVLTLGAGNIWQVGEKLLKDE